MQKISVLVPNLFGCCTYFSRENLEAGTFVSVPFGRTMLTGVVWQTPVDETFPENKIKPIAKVLDIPLLSEDGMRFLEWVASYTLTPPGLVLKMMLIPELEKISKKPLVFEEPVFQNTETVFSPAQQKAVDILKNAVGSKDVFLLDGVTGSGKTEVYFEAVSKALQSSDKAQVLVMLPEITLTGQWLKRFEKRFGVKPACWHSEITPKVRRDTWHAVASGKARVVVGARSALFLPYKNLKLIVVDEEHDASYKQEDGVMYQARDMAVLRAHIGAFPIILASATPSLETLANVAEGKYKKAELPERFFENALPEIKTVDMRQEKGILSAELLKEIAENIVAGNQTLLFLNRRGYAPIRLCKSCGEKMTCPHCSVCLTEHKTRKIMLCHQCGYFTSVKTDCRSCGEKDTLISCGMGVERVAEEIISLFPKARVKVISSDTVSSKKQFEEVLNGLENKEIDILIGTQMLAKGHHFPDLTLVGVLDADFSLSGGDLRACERTFQLLQQVAGRAGRQHKKGRVLIQTHTPENVVISAMKNGDRNAFLENETEARKLLQMPPFGRLAALILSGKKEERVLTVAHELAKKAPFVKGVEILGPVQAPISLLRGKYRYRFLIKTPKNFKLQKMLQMWLSSVSVPTDITLKADIDPYSFF